MHHDWNVLPTTVPLDLVLVENDRMVVALTGFAASPAGLSFLLWVRRDRDGAPSWSHELSIDDPLRAGWSPDAEAAFRNPAAQLSVEFADGRAARMDPGRVAGQTVQEIFLVSGNALWGSRDAYAEIFLVPVPPPGPLKFRYSWPAEDIPSAQVEIDTAPIHEAAGSARWFWYEPRSFDQFRRQRRRWREGPPPEVPGTVLFDDLRERLRQALRATGGDPDAPTPAQAWEALNEVGQLSVRDEIGPLGEMLSAWIRRPSRRQPPGSLSPCGPAAYPRGPPYGCGRGPA